MAFMNQEKKAVIAAEVKKVMPKGWKYSLSVHHHSSITLTIQSAPIDLIAAYNAHMMSPTRQGQGRTELAVDDIDVNCCHLGMQFSGELLKTFEAINAALNTGNFDKSDIQSDYFHVGFYAYIKIGRWNKPFVVA